MLEAHAIESGYALNSLVESGYTVTVYKHNIGLGKPGVTVYMERDNSKNIPTYGEYFVEATMLEALKKAYAYEFKGDVK